MWKDEALLKAIFYGAEFEIVRTCTLMLSQRSVRGLKTNYLRFELQFFDCVEESKFLLTAIK